MDTGTQPHPLMAGMRIEAIRPGRPGPPNPGTLTGLATRRSDGKRVLATNLHVMSPNILGRRPVPVGNEEMHQPNYLGRASRIVGRLAGRRYSVDPMLDIAVCELEPGIPETELTFKIHSPDHNLGVILPGVREPERGMDLTVVGASGGIGKVKIMRVNARVPRDIMDPTGSFITINETGVTILDVTERPVLIGDSGAPCLYEERPGIYRMSAILYSGHVWIPEGYAFPASLAESELGIIFGDPRFGGGEMGIPILTSEGFVGQRTIIDDYFIAGERLNAGDVVGIKSDPDEGNEPRLFRVGPGMDAFRVIGIVHTPAGKEVGDHMADNYNRPPTGASFVPVVVKGLTKALCAGPISIGDPVTPAGNVVILAGRGNIARVQVASENSDPIVGRSISAARSANQVVEVLVDLAGSIAEPIPADAVEHLGPITEENWVGAGAEWSSSQESVNSPGSYARFFSFTLQDEADVNIRLQSAVDAWLYILEGGAISGLVQDSFNSGKSLILSGQRLEAGTYTLEIVTSQAAVEGDFAVTVMKDADIRDFSIRPLASLGSVEASWRFPEMRGVEFLMKYHETEDPSTERQEVVEVGAHVVISGLAPGVEYSFELQMDWECGNRRFGRVLGSGAAAAFPAPSGFTVSPTNIAGELEPKWTPPPVLFDPRTDSYELQYRDVSVFGEVDEFLPSPWEPSLPLTPSGTTFFIAGLSYGSYEFRLRAKYVDGNGRVSYSAYVYDTAFPMSRPAPSALGTAFEQSGSVRAALVSWTHPSDFDAAHHLSQSQYRSSSNGVFSGWSPLTDHAAAVQQVSFTDFEKAVEFRVRTKYVDPDDYSERLSEFAYATWRPPAPASLRASPGNVEGDMVVSLEHDPIFDPSLDHCDLQHRRLDEEFELLESAWEPGSSHVIHNLALGDYEVRVRAVYYNGGAEGHSEWVIASGYPLAEFLPSRDFRISAGAGLMVHVDPPPNSALRPGVRVGYFEAQSRTVGDEAAGFGRLVAFDGGQGSGPLPYEPGETAGIRVRAVYTEDVTGGEYRSPWLYQEFSTAFPASNLAVEFRESDSVVA